MPRIAVLVKQMPDHEALVQVTSDTTLQIEDRWATAFFDEIALEAALVLKAALPDAELVALSAGGRKAVDACRRAIAMGFDQVERLGDETLEDAPSHRVAAVLAARLSGLRPDVILCGKVAGPDDQAAVGPMVAELLGMPHVSQVVSLKLDAAARTAIVERQADGEVVTIRAPWPVLLTAEKGLAVPHLPVVMRVMKAMKAKIPEVSLADLGIAALESEPRVRRLRVLPPPARPPVRMITAPHPENVNELLNRLSEAGVLG